MQALDFWLGEWDSKLWLGSKETEPSIGKYFIRMAPDGRWMLADYQAVFEGEDFWGQQAFTYDSEKGQYFSTWIDSSQAIVLSGHSTFDSEKRTLTSESIDALGQNTYEVTHFPDDNHFEYTMDVIEKDGTRKTVMWATAVRK